MSHFILMLYQTKPNLQLGVVYNTLTAPCKKSTVVVFISTQMKRIAVPPVQSKFVVTLIRCIASGSASSACFLLKYILISLAFLEIKIIK